MAWVSACTPEVVADLDRIVWLAEKVAARRPRKYATLKTRGAALYRAVK